MARQLRRGPCSVALVQSLHLFRLSALHASAVAERVVGTLASMPNAQEDLTYDEERLRRAGERVGELLSGRWHLDSLIGVGGMASVYAATHRNGKRVAIKILHPELSTDAGVKQRFIDEGYVANQVNHPGTVSVLDDGETAEGLVFLVMDLLEGETLEETLAVPWHYLSSTVGTHFTGSISVRTLPTKKSRLCAIDAKTSLPTHTGLMGCGLS